MGSRIIIELDNEAIKDIEDAKHYEGDESFVMHCGYDLIRLYDEAMEEA